MILPLLFAAEIAAAQPAPPPEPSIYEILASEEARLSQAYKELSDSHMQSALSAKQVGEITAERDKLKAANAALTAERDKLKESVNHPN